MLLKKIILPYIVLCFLCLTSCFEDTDFDQANDILLTPEVELDLIFFTLDASQFYNDVINTDNLVVIDTTDIEFLNGRDIKNILKRAEFLFKFDNSIPRNFNVSFDFLNDQNESTFFTETSVAQGSVNNPVQTNFTEEVDGEEITDLTKSNKVVITVSIPSASEDLTGTLNLKSKTTYYLEID